MNLELELNELKRQVSKVYEEFAGISYTHYKAEEIIRMIKDNFEQRKQLDIIDGIEDMVKDELITQEVANIILENANDYI